MGSCPETDIDPKLFVKTIIFKNCIFFSSRFIRLLSLPLSLSPSFPEEGGREIECVLLATTLVK